MLVLLEQWILILFEKKISWLPVRRRARSIFGILIQTHRQLSPEVSNQRTSNTLLGTSKVFLSDCNQRNCMPMLGIIYFYANLSLKINIIFISFSSAFKRHSRFHIFTMLHYMERERKETDI